MADDTRRCGCLAHLILKRQSRLRNLKLKGLLPKTSDAGGRCVPPGRPRRVKIRRWCVTKQRQD